MTGEPEPERSWPLKLVAGLLLLGVGLGSIGLWQSSRPTGATPSIG